MMDAHHTRTASTIMYMTETIQVDFRYSAVRCLIVIDEPMPCPGCCFYGYGWTAKVTENAGG